MVERVWCRKVISSRATKEFLERKLNNYDWVKQVSEKDLDAEIGWLRPKPSFKTPLWKHQKAGFLVGMAEPKFLFLYDMGIGKSKMILDILAHRAQLNGASNVESWRRALVLVPNNSNIYSWQQDAAKHMQGPYRGIEMALEILAGTSDEKWWAYNRMFVDHPNGPTVFVASYPGLLSMVCHKADGKMIIDPEKLAWFTDQIQAVVFDESTELKNWNSLTYDVCKRLAEACPIRYALAGFPHGRNPADLWAQFRIIDGGETLGPTLGLFRSAFFDQKKNYWGGYEYTLQPERKDQLHQTIKNKSLRYVAEECIDLPERIAIKKPVELGREQRKHYTNAVNGIIEAKGNKLELKNAFVRLRQICSGFLGLKTDSMKIEMALPTNPKLDLLMEMLQEMPATAKAIVFHDYIWSGAQIEKALGEEKIGCGRLWSGTKDHGKVLEDFNSDPKCRVLVVNNQSGAYGLNLQVSNYVFFYETPLSLIDRQQAERRSRRGGQKASKVFIYDLVCQRTVEEKLLAYMEDGKDLFAAIVDGKETLR